MRAHVYAPTGVSYDEDRSLLLGWRDGDSAAGDALVRKHYASVHRFFEVKATTVADDLTQRTFLACTESFERLARAASFRAFLFGIARNVLLQHLDRRRDAAANCDFDEIPSRTTRASALVARQLEQQLVLRAMAELPDELAQTLQLYYWEGMRMREIADATECSPTAVSTRLYRARRQLREVAMGLARGAEVRNRLAADIDGIARSIANAATPRDSAQGG